VNQHGQVQAIGGVNEKVAGFFDVCAARRLTGAEGVIIPDANRKHLMLRRDIVPAAEKGKFHVYAVSHVDQAMELLVGQPAGIRDKAGHYPADSVNGQIQSRLEGLRARTVPPCPGRVWRSQARCPTLVDGARAQSVVVEPARWCR